MATVNDRFEVSRLAAPLGARVRGCDLGALGDKAFRRLHDLLLEHQVLAVSGQSLTPEGQVALARRWGEPTHHPISPHMPGHPELIEIRNQGKATTLNEHWHSDVTFHEHPPKLTMLHALEMPELGGDTLFASQYLAYEALSDGMKQLLDGLRAVHSAAGFAARVGQDPAAAPSAEHPVVRTHDESGRKALYVCRAFTRSFVGMSRRESAPLLEFLYEHTTQPDFQMRLVWEPGDVVLWDNRCVLHYAVHDHGDAPRTLRRVTIDGPRPV